LADDLFHIKDGLFKLLENALLAYELLENSLLALKLL